MAVMVRQEGAMRALSFSVDLPPEAVYDYLSDFQKHREWVPDIVEMRQETDGPAGVGTRYTTVESIKEGAKMTAATSSEITALERPRFVEWRARTSADRGPMAMRSRWSFTIEPEGNGSRVTQRYAMEPPGPSSKVFLALFGPIADLMGGLGASRKGVKRHAEQLERVLATKAAETRSASGAGTS